MASAFENRDSAPGASDRRAALRALIAEENRDWVWLRRSRIGASQLESGSLRAGLRVLVRTAELTERFPSGDPRRAASLNNAGVASACAGQPAAAIGFFEAAERAWSVEGRAWVEGMRLGQRARSSLFHLRMERRHREHYEAMARDEHLWALDVGGLISRLNHAEAADRQGEHEAAVQACTAAWHRARDRFGEEHPVTLLARRRLERAGGSPGRATAAGLARWGDVAGLEPVRPPAMSDEPRVGWALHWILTIGGRAGGEA